MKNAIKAGNKWYADKIKEGWEITPNGLLSPQEIRLAGYVRMNERYAIPTIVCIAEYSTGMVMKGQKFLRVSQRYLDWCATHNWNNNVEDKIDQQIEQDEIDVEDVNF